MPGSLSPREVVRSRLCIGCGSCVAQAPREAAAVVRLDASGLYRPDGSSSWLRRRTAALARTCPFSAHAANEDALGAALFPMAPRSDPWAGRYVRAWVGSVAEGRFREDGSSGGMTTWVLCELLSRGLVDGVAHVVARSDPGLPFAYRVSRSRQEILEGAKSRYYPVEISGVLAEMRSRPGRYAFVGVPCFVKAVQLLRREDEAMAERIAFTLGLFCGHMKSARFLESIAWQMGTDAGSLRGADFRRKDPARPASTYTASLVLEDGRVLERDWWNLADGDWGAGFFQSPACDWCDDVVGETADACFGDAWVEPYASDGRGANVVIVRSPVLDALVQEAAGDGRLHLAAVDGEFVHRTQAAGFRHRREGLAYRLHRRRGGLVPAKRVRPSNDLPLRRKGIYRMRTLIARWSHRVFRLARRIGRPGLYIRWARAAAAVYHALAYSRGRLGGWLARILPAG